MSLSLNQACLNEGLLSNNKHRNTHTHSLSLSHTHTHIYIYIYIYHIKTRTYIYIYIYIYIYMQTVKNECQYLKHFRKKGTAHFLKIPFNLPVKIGLILVEISTSSTIYRHVILICEIHIFKPVLMDCAFKCIKCLRWTPSFKIFIFLHKTSHNLQRDPTDDFDNDQRSSNVHVFGS